MHLKKNSAIHQVGEFGLFLNDLALFLTAHWCVLTTYARSEHETPPQTHPVYSDIQPPNLNAAHTSEPYFFAELTLKDAARSHRPQWFIFYSALKANTLQGPSQLQVNRRESWAEGRTVFSMLPTSGRKCLHVSHSLLVVCQLYQKDCVNNSDKTWVHFWLFFFVLAVISCLLLRV